MDFAIERVYPLLHARMQKINYFAVENVKRNGQLQSGFPIFEIKRNTRYTL